MIFLLWTGRSRPLSHIHGHFVQDGPGEHVLGAIPQDLRQDVPGLDAGIDRALWKRIRMAATVCHGGVLLARVGSWGV